VVLLQKKLSASCKKTRLIPGKHPDADVQESFVEKIMGWVEKAKKGTVDILFCDPMHQVHNNENGYCWQIKGGKNTINTRANTGRRRLTLLGALNPLTLIPDILLTEANCDRETMKAFFKHLRTIYTDMTKPLVLILDNASYHHAYEVQDIAKELNIILEFLPPYCPNLNLIERLWKFFKKKQIQNAYYSDFSEFYEATIQFFHDIDHYKEELSSLLSLKFEIIK